ncbi:hypothetical protein HWC35_gp167 [Vibrio phage USC-1]|uniref:Uncharacterized protein n=2 Tax=Aphroditevirus USC1 TaxID=2846605 RepID=A0A514A2R7_9CAUD|nr:hypothetical protein HWC35_gp167 [Vibrio phage USC-1]QCW23168.1 hypothetical protein [Vibrio phage 5 TSL-2019]QDH47561.1 hypothetical protein [Vibrio phage USC-1]
MKATTLIKTPIYGLISFLISFLLWCNINYETNEASGRITDIFPTNDGEGAYDYFILTGDELIQCELDEEKHRLINGQKYVKIKYGTFPTGEQICLTITI